MILLFFSLFLFLLLLAYSSTSFMGKKLEYIRS